VSAVGLAPEALAVVHSKISYNTSKNNQENSIMDMLIYLFQAILAIKFFSTAYSHGMQKNIKMELSIERMGNKAITFHRVIAIICIVGALAILVPEILGKLVWIVPVTLVLLALLMLISILFHNKYRDKPILMADLGLAMLCVFVLIGKYFFQK
jgi:hypothetical protein